MFSQDRNFKAGAVISSVMCVLQSLLSIPCLFNAETAQGKGPRNHPPYMGPEKVGPSRYNWRAMLILCVVPQIGWPLPEKTA